MASSIVHTQYVMMLIDLTISWRLAAHFQPILMEDRL